MKLYQLKSASIIAVSISVFVIPGCGQVSTPSTGGERPNNKNGSAVVTGSVQLEIDVKHGRQLIADKKYEKAVNWAKKALKDEPTHLDAGLILVLGNIYQKKVTQAKEVSADLIERYPTEARVITAHAMALASNDQVTEAITQLKKGVAQAPKSVHIHSALAGLYMRQNDPLNAQKHFISVRSLDPTYDGIPVSGGFKAFSGWVEQHQGPISLALALIGGLVKFIAALA